MFSAGKARRGICDAVASLGQIVLTWSPSLMMCVLGVEFSGKHAKNVAISVNTAFPLLMS